MWIFGGKSESGFNANNNAEQVTEGIDGTALTAIVTGPSLVVLFLFLFLPFVC